MIVIERPTKRQRVMDIVAQAGIDVSDWENTSGHPASNPKYCYEWCFEKPGKLVLFSLWYEGMIEEKGQIFQLLNYKAFADTSAINNRPKWVSRARRMDSLIYQAWRDSLTVRVMVCDGKRQEISKLGAKPSKVNLRYLDPATWRIVSYDQNTGACVVERNTPFQCH